VRFLFHNAATTARACRTQLPGWSAACLPALAVAALNVFNPARTQPGMTNAATLLSRFRQKLRRHAFVRCSNLPDLTRFFSPQGITEGLA
jgi:hypothetical protein